MKIKTNRTSLAKQYAGLLKSVFDGSLVSIFLFGSVARGEDTENSDIDLMTILRKPPASRQLRKIGKPGRFGEIRGREKFPGISCAVVPQDKFLELAREGAPREAINPLREAVIFQDNGFISGLKKELETGLISLKKNACLDYLRYGDIRRSCLRESIAEKNAENARSDAAKAATHYLRAYFLYKYNEMILSKEVLKERAREEDCRIAALYERIVEGDCGVDIVEKTREWVREKIGAVN